MNIKLKLILIFIVLKVVPLALLTIITIEWTKELGDSFGKDSKELLEDSIKVVSKTADMTIADSITALDRKSQESIEISTVQIAEKVANFLYERDRDLIFLSRLDLSRDVLKSFYDSKNRPITLHKEYYYDKESDKWVTATKIEDNREKIDSILDDNSREFHKVHSREFQNKKIPIYREITLFDLSGKEKLKVGDISHRLKDISKKENTYIGSETYFKEIDSLENGEIYVSEVIGEYVGSKIIGTYSRAKTEKAGIPFEPENSAYAGTENPVGKRFDGIVRFVTPIFRDGVKTGYLSLALNHRHIMEFSDYFLPTSELKTDISDASKGNYAFMWDNLGRTISHPRDYFIAGFDSQTGERVEPWVSRDLYEKFLDSGTDNLNLFLETVEPFEAQSLKKKPAIQQIKEGNLALDCRYLNFAPQCRGWFQLVEDGGYGSFIIFWSKVWKLTTASAIPYYTGRYGESKIGFGFVTIGANVDEFHRVANETKLRVDEVIENQTKSMHSAIEKTKESMNIQVERMIDDIVYINIALLVIIVLIAIWIANSITKRIFTLIKGAEKLSENQFDHKIAVEGSDELSRLAIAFNSMSFKLNDLFNTLEEKVEDRTQKLSNTLKKLKKAQKSIMDSIEYASVIQHSLLPVDGKFEEMVSDSFVIWKPRDVVGGDIYIYQEYDDGFLLFVIDCTGHGVPGAFMTMITGAVLENIVTEDNRKDPALIFGEMNRIIRKALNQDRDETLSDDGLDATAIFYDKIENRVTFAGAKNPLIYIKDNELVTIKGDRMSIGYKRSEPDFEFTNRVIDIDRDTYIYLLTDGISDQLGGDKRRMYGNKRLKNAILENHKMAFNSQKEIILKEFEDYRGSIPRVDDVTLIGMKIEKRGS